MRKSGFSLLTTLVVGVCAVPSAAFAQDAPAAPPPAAVAPAAAPAPDAPGVAPATPATMPAGAPGAAAPPPAAEPPAPAAPAAPPAPPAEAAAAPAPTYPATTITGFVEGAYERMLGSAHIGQAVPTRAYDTANGFQLHLAHLAVKHQLNENVYGFIAFNAGADSNINHNPGYVPGGQQTLFDVPEAYAAATGEGLTFTAGKFTTYEGIEVYQGPANPTITRGFLYWLAEPVTHVGAKLHYATGPLDIGIGLVNGWDTNNALFKTADNNNKKTFIWRAAVTPSPMFFAALSGTYGVEQADDSDARLSVDLTGAVVPADFLTINFQGNVGSEKGTGADPTKTSSWYGFGLQPVVKSGAVSLGGRFEYFKDKNGSRTVVAGDPSLINLTIAPGYTIASAFTVRGELRYDHSSVDMLSQDPNGPKKSQGTFAISAHYVF